MSKTISTERRKNYRRQVDGRIPICGCLHEHYQSGNEFAQRINWLVQ